MTAKTRGGCFGVIKRQRLPMCGDVARGTIIRGDWMVRSLADCGGPIVAIEAGTRGNVVVHYGGDDETARGMTGLTLRRYRDVADTLTAGKLSVVTRNTLRGQAFEHCVDMAVFAFNQGMHAHQWESGGQVIKILVSRTRQRAKGEKGAGYRD